MDSLFISAPMSSIHTWVSLCILLLDVLYFNITLRGRYFLKVGASKFKKVTNASYFNMSFHKKIADWIIHFVSNYHSSAQSKVVQVYNQLAYCISHSSTQKPCKYEG